MSIKNFQTDLHELTKSIQLLVKKRKKQVLKNINNEILLTYWEIGKLIVERETENNIDQKSSRSLILELSKILSIQIGKGFSRSNLTYMRLFFLKYPTGATLSHHQSWSH